MYTYIYIYVIIYVFIHPEIDRIWFIEGIYCASLKYHMIYARMAVIVSSFLQETIRRNFEVGRYEVRGMNKAYLR